jgi:riboflavin biosynthesis pyrimidine reductase
MTRAVESAPKREPPHLGDFRLQELFSAPIEAEGTRGGSLPGALSEHFEGELRIRLRDDRPTVIANFVTTLDGVVAFDAEGLSGGGEVSGFYGPDRFMMGLLRSLADVVLVGAGTVRAAPKHEWTARHVHRRSARAYADFRRASGVPSGEPTTMVVTAAGGLDPQHPGLSAADVPVVIATSAAGAKRLEAQQFGSNVSIEVAGDGDVVPAENIIALAARVGARVVLCEGGPHVIGDLLAARLLDELFLTVAPQVAGRDETTTRLALVEGTAFAPTDAPWAALRSVHRSLDHLFLRYDLSSTRG